MATEESIKLWLKVGNLRKLEQAVLDGFGDQLRGRNSRIPKINKFLKRVPHFQAKIAGIHDAACKGNIRELETLLDRKPLVLGRDRNGATPLHIAAVHKQANIVKYLLEKYPACLHAKDNQGRTALHYAAVADDGGEIYRILTEAGSDTDIADLSGKTPKDYLEKPEDLPLQKLLEATSGADGTSSNSQAAREISSGLIRQPSPMSPLTRTELRALIQRGELGKLERAVALGHGEKLLGETAVNTRVRDLIDSIPDHLARVGAIHEAASNGSLRTLKNLLNRKLLIVARDSQGMTALHKAAIANQKPIIEYLLQVSPKAVHTKDHEKRTALHYAAVLPQSDSDIYNLLIEAGACNTLPDVYGKTPEFYRQNPEALQIKKLEPKTTVSNVKANSDEATPKTAKRDSSPNQTSKSGSLIKQWLRNGDLEKLEKAVIEGHGLRLLREPTADPRARAFLRTVPAYMAKMALLHEAACRGEVRNLRLLLDRRKLAMSRDQLGLNLLHKAVLFGQTDVVRFLLEEYPEILNMKDKNGRTALHYAAVVKGKDDLFQMLVDAGADPNQPDSKGQGAQFYKDNEDELGLAELMSRINKQRSRKRSKVVHASKPQPENGFTITGGNIRKWIHAEDLRRLEQVVLEGQGYKLLLETSNNPRVKQFLNGVPGLVNKIREVHLAAAMGDLSALENIVLEKPLLLSSKDELGMTPLHKAVISDQPAIVEYIIGQKPSGIEARDELGRTPLHYAAGIKDGGQIFNVLLNAGAEPSLQDNKGKAAEHYARHPGELDIRQMQAHIQRTKPQQNINGNNKAEQSNISSKPPSHPILRPIRKPPNSGMSSEAINRIIQSGDLEKLEQMILDGHGKRLVGKTSWNEDVRAFLRKVPHYMDKIYAVHTASATGDLLLLQQLLDKKKMVVSKDEYGLTPLHKAIKYGQTDVIQFLLQTYPAGHTAKDQDGRTPMHYASMYKDRNDLYRLLLDRGADPHVKDQRGKSPETYLACHSKLEIPAPPRPIEKLSQADDDHTTSQDTTGTESTGDAEIERWITEGSIEDLEKLIIDGHGEKLLGKTSSDPKVKEFLECVPAYMGKIRAIHNASASGELKDIQTLLDSELLAQSRDEHGATPWHRSILNGHKDVMRYLAHNYPSTINVQDKTGLTPLHYAALVNDEGLFYKLLLNCGANPNIKDINGNSPGQYLRGKPTVTLEELIKRYEERKVPPRPPSVQMWERPPTEELLRALTPSPMPEDISRMISTNHPPTDESSAEQPEDVGEISSPDRTNEDDAAEADDEDYSGDSDKCTTFPDAAPLVEDSEKGDVTLGTLQEESDPGTLEDKETTQADDVGIETIDGYVKSSSDEFSKTVKSDEGYSGPEISDVEEVDDDAEEHVTKYNTNTILEEEGPTQAIKDDQVNTNIIEDDSKDEKADTEDENVNNDTINYEQENDGVASNQTEDDNDDTIKNSDNTEAREVDSNADKHSDRVKDDTVTNDDTTLPSVHAVSEVPNSSSLESTTKDQTNTSSFGTENPMTWTKEGDYLAAVLGDALIKSLTDVSITRPENPIGQLAIKLYQHAKEQDQFPPGSSILHFAASRPHEEGALQQLIVQSDCSLAARNCRLRTPREVAIETSQAKNINVFDSYIKQLIRDGNVEALDELLLDGYQSFYIPLDDHETMREDVSQFLANVDSFQDQRECFHKAIRDGDLEKVKDKADARLARAKNIKSQCSLHLTVISEDLGMIHYLATHFPEIVNICDNQFKAGMVIKYCGTLSANYIRKMGRTPLHYAMATSKTELIIKILSDNGADRLLKDDLKHTPCYYYIRRSEIQHLKAEETSI